MDEAHDGLDRSSGATASGGAPDRGGDVPWPGRLRGHGWTAIQRAAVIAALAIVMGSLFVTTYTLALGDPALPVELRSPLAQPAAAIRAFGYVRADLGLAVLANYEQVRAASAHRSTDCMTAAMSGTGFAPRGVG